MPELYTQADLRSVRSLPFCYLCGRGFGGRTEKTRDHVPPKAIFATADRELPLILPTHRRCNEAQSGYDEIIGQFIAVIHGKRPTPERSRMDVRVVTTEKGTPMMGRVGTNLQNVIGRWLRGFHSALYREFLPSETSKRTRSPPISHRKHHRAGPGLAWRAFSPSIRCLFR